MTLQPSSKDNKATFIEKLDIPSIREPVARSKVTFYDREGNILSRKAFNYEQPVTATIEYYCDTKEEIQ